MTIIKKWRTVIVVKHFDRVHSTLFINKRFFINYILIYSLYFSFTTHTRYTHWQITAATSATRDIQFPAGTIATTKCEQLLSFSWFYLNSFTIALCILYRRHQRRAGGPTCMLVSIIIIISIFFVDLTPHSFQVESCQWVLIVHPFQMYTYIYID